MTALNGSTLGQPMTERAIRERTINGLFEPVREIVRAAEALHRALVSGDRERISCADSALQQRIDEYVERMTR